MNRIHIGVLPSPAPSDEPSPPVVNQQDSPAPRTTALPDSMNMEPSLAPGSLALSVSEARFEPRLPIATAQLASRTSAAQTGFASRRLPSSIGISQDAAESMDRQQAIRGNEIASSVNIENPIPQELTANGTGRAGLTYPVGEAAKVLPAPRPRGKRRRDVEPRCRGPENGRRIVGLRRRASLSRHRSMKP